MKRSVRDIKGGVSIIDEVEVREAVVTKETIQAPEFAVYQKALRDCFNRTAVILERR